jgi:5-methylcytosine-specific restriction protein A
MTLKTLKPRLSVLTTTRIPVLQGTERLRGQAAVDRRARWLRAHPLCVQCQAQGVTTAGQVVDHITPLWQGGADDYGTNGQTLCNEHHDAKSAKEAALRARGG